MSNGSSSPDSNTLWLIHDSDREGQPCETGKPIKCGDLIRLEHSKTGKNLHSGHAFKAPLSDFQEVSGFGVDGEGDEDDDWQIVCNEIPALGTVNNFGDKIMGEDFFHFKHVNTGCMLISNQEHPFTHKNCPRCPIVGHLEAACIYYVNDKTTLWKIDSGYFFPPKGVSEENDEEEDDQVGTVKNIINEEL